MQITPLHTQTQHQQNYVVYTEKSPVINSEKHHKIQTQRNPTYWKQEILPSRDAVGVGLSDIPVLQLQESPQYSHSSHSRRSVSSSPTVLATKATAAYCYKQGQNQVQPRLLIKDLDNSSSFDHQQVTQKTNLVIGPATNSRTKIVMNSGRGNRRHGASSNSPHHPHMRQQAQQQPNLYYVQQQSQSNPRSIAPPHNYPPQQRARGSSFHMEDSSGSGISKQDVFMPDSSGMGWVCRHCCGIPLIQRAPGSIWNNPEAPPLSHIESHLSVCRGNVSCGNPSPQSRSAAMIVQPPSGQPMHPGMFAQSNEFLSHSGEAYHPVMRHPMQAQHHARSNQGLVLGNPNAYPPHPMYSKQQQSQPLPQSYHHPQHHMQPHGHMYQGGGEKRQQSQPSLTQSQAPPVPQFTMPQIRVSRHLVLVQEDDALLLSQYFYYLMMQLQICYFAESDRKTRGGKRDNIAVGFGGLQCYHCAKRADARKFFWSDVDRLANSFAEIPNHVLKCRECPDEVKNNLRMLKALHPSQMAKLPRGSQKVFFRRMWRRIHNKTEEQMMQNAVSRANGEENLLPDSSPSPTAEEQLLVKTNRKDDPVSADRNEALAALSSPVPTSKADESESQKEKPSKGPGLLSSSGRVLLAIDDDKDWLSDMDCFVRRNLEIFQATKPEMVSAEREKRAPVVWHQVGIRCIHCATVSSSMKRSCEIAGETNTAEHEVRGTAIYYPTSIENIYECVRNFQRYHFESCVNVPPEVQTELAGLSQCTSLSSVLRRYYVLAAKALGMIDLPGGQGIVFKNDAAPVANTTAKIYEQQSDKSELTTKNRKLDDKTEKVEIDKEEKEPESQSALMIDLTTAPREGQTKRSYSNDSSDDAEERGAENPETKKIKHS